MMHKEERKIHAKVDALIRTEGLAKVLKRLREEGDIITVKKSEAEPSKQTNKTSRYGGTFITREQFKNIDNPLAAPKTDAMKKDPVTIRDSQIYVNFRNRQFRIDDKTFSLAARRFDLFCALLCNDGPVSRDDLLTGIWGIDHFDPKVVDITVARLRNDLRAVQNLISIQTTRHGYELKPGDRYL